MSGLPPPPTVEAEEPQMEGETRLLQVEDQLRQLAGVVLSTQQLPAQVRNIEETMIQLVNHLQGLTTEGPSEGPAAQLNTNATPSGSDGRTQGFGPGPMNLDGTDSDVHLSSSSTAHVNPTSTVHVSNMSEATTTGKLERMPAYKGDRKNDAAAIWLMRVDNVIANQEELSGKRFQDRRMPVTPCKVKPMRGGSSIKRRPGKKALPYVEFADKMERELQHVAHRKDFFGVRTRRGRAYARPTNYRKKDADGDTQMTLNSMKSTSVPGRGTDRSFRGSSNMPRGGSNQTSKADQQLCYNCDKPGHIKRECPEPLRQNATRGKRGSFRGKGPRR
ncbi:hypothetical protein LTR93_011202 [Exophiala xenobiotica]|nr:hypothetical protein LTR93_011202 [Exophiala xenobiotica]